MSNLTATKLTRYVLTGPSGLSASKVVRFLVLDTSATDSGSTAPRKRITTHIRYGDNT